MFELFNKLEQKIMQFSFDKVRNVAADEKDKLNYERRKIVFTLMKKKECRVGVIKKKILWKFYLCLLKKKFS